MASIGYELIFPVDLVDCIEKDLQQQNQGRATERIASQIGMTRDSLKGMHIHLDNDQYDRVVIYVPQKIPLQESDTIRRLNFAEPPIATEDSTELE